MASNIGRYSVSPAELQMFMDHVDQRKMTSVLDKEITQIAEKALEDQNFATFTETQFDEFKKIEKEFLGEFVSTETFRQQLGIEPKGTKTPEAESHIDQTAMKNLLGDWMKKDPDEVAKKFSKMEPFEQKVFLKALSHFSQTTDVLRASKGGLTPHEILILLSLSEKVTQSKVPFPTEKGPISPETYRLFKQLYPLYKGVKPTDDEMTQSNEANTYLSTSREAAQLGQSYAPDLSAVKSAPPSIAKKRAMRSGEKRIGGEVKNDVRQLSRAGADLKLRLGKSVFGVTDTSLNNDIARYFASSRITVAKAEALVALYSPYMMQDPDIALLGAKAMADLAHVLALEGDARAFLEETSQSSLLGNEKADSLREQSRNLFKEAEILAEWARLKGQPKAGILLSKLIRINANTLTKEEKTTVYKKAQDVLKASFKGDQEALVENAKLHTAMWINGDATEEDALAILQPLGKKGADALREHFEAGNAEAGKRLADIILTKSKSETFKEKFQRFIQSVTDLFSSGNTVLAGEEPLLSKDPHRLSSAETDFLIKEALISSKNGDQIRAAIQQKHLGPKVPLNQARGLLNLTGEKVDPDMVVNRQEAYRHILSAGISLLSPVASDEAKQNFVDETLAPYLKKIDQKSYAYSVLSGLLVDLGGSSTAVRGASPDVSESETEEKEVFGTPPSSSPNPTRRSSTVSNASSKDEFFDAVEGEDFVLPPSPGISRRSSIVSESDGDDSEYDYDIKSEIWDLKGSRRSSVASQTERPDSWTGMLEQMFEEIVAPVRNWKDNKSATISLESSPETSASEMDLFTPPPGGGGYEWLDDIPNEGEGLAVTKPTGQSTPEKQVQVVAIMANTTFHVVGTWDEIKRFARVTEHLQKPTRRSFDQALQLAAPLIKAEFSKASPELIEALLKIIADIREKAAKHEVLPPANITEIIEDEEKPTSTVSSPAFVEESSSKVDEEITEVQVVPPSPIPVEMEVSSMGSTSQPEKTSVEDIIQSWLGAGAASLAAILYSGFLGEGSGEHVENMLSREDMTSMGNKSKRKEINPK